MMKTLISLLFYLGLQVSLSGNVIVVIGSPNTDTYANYGDNITLQVVAYDSHNVGQPLHFTWQRNGQVMASYSDGNLSDPNNSIYKPYVSNLSISNFSPYHEGNYTVLIQAIEGSRTLTFSLSNITSDPPSSSTAEYYNVSDSGNSVTFDVQNNIPQGSFSISWYKDGNLITDAGSYQFSIYDVGASDAGTYEAKISNSFGSASQVFVLDVVGNPPQTYGIGGPRTLQVGNRLDLSFYLNPEDANAVVTWYKDDQIFPLNSPQFVIENVNASNAGEYYAVITNDFGQTNTNTVNVVVAGNPPQTYYLNDPGILYEDNYERLDLSFYLNPEDANAVVTWYKDDQIFPIDSDQFVIENVNASNAGEYYAVITNDFGQTNTNTVNVVVAGNPPQTYYLNDPGILYEDNYERLDLSFYLNPEDANAVVTWYKDDQIFPIDSDQFVIENVNASNAGEYYAVITNDFGQTNTNTINVVVAGNPPQTYYLNDPGILYEDNYERLDLSFYLNPEDANAVVTWYKDDQIFPIDSDQFVIENVNASNAGEYYAVITNDFGQTNTNTINVVVTQSGNERDTFNDLGYYTPEQFENLRIGSTIITPLDGVGTLSIQIEKSNDLNSWSSSADDILTHQIPLSNDKQFFRLTLPNAE
jgi:hypothetical protein